MKKTNKLLQKHFDTALESPEGIKKLRELILTLAMQGKLVPQNPNDPPASELLKKILAEKKKLIAEGMIKKQKELPEIKPDEVPFELPEGWVWTRLGVIAELIGGFAYNSQEFKNHGDKQVLRLGNIRPDLIRLDENPVFIDNKRAIDTSAFQLKQGDIVITMTGTRAKRDYLYTARIVENPINGKTLYINQRVGSIRLFFDSTFINIALKVESLKDLIFETSTGSANQANIGMIALRHWTIPLPPLAEQKRIVTKIDELMVLCDKLEEQRASRDQKRLEVHTSAINRLLTAADKNEFHTSWQFITRHFDPIYSVKENVAELKKAILTLAMQGKLVPQKPNDPPASELLKQIQAEKEKLIVEGKIKKQKELPEIKPEDVPYEVPEGWVWARLGHSGETQTGTTPATKDPDNFGDYIPFVGPGNIKNQIINYSEKGLSEKGLEKGRLIKKDSILMVCIGGSIGKHAINIIDVACNQQVNTITPFCNDIRFLFFAMWSDLFQKNVISAAGGSATPIINKNKWSMITVPIPPLAEQKRIVAKIDELMVLCDKLESQIDQATQKQTALFNAVLAQV